MGAAVKATQRARTLAATPQLAGALGDGGTTAAHIDVITRAAGQLPTAQRDKLLARADQLVAVAEVSTPEQFARRVAIEAKRIQADDGIDRLARQRRNVRVSTWVDADGMWNLRGLFDPVSGVRLAAKLRATIDAMFAEAVPEGCPDDPFEKQRFLAGHALIALIEATAGVGRAGRAEFVVVIDADADPATDGPGPVAEWPIPVEIPARVLADLAGGTTDLDNLIPTCTRHHAKIHNDGWVIELGPHRELTLRLPDGTIHNTGPPGRRTAS